MQSTPEAQSSDSTAPDFSAVLNVLRMCAFAVRKAVFEASAWSIAGTRAHQYRVDLVADAVAVDCLTRSGMDVLSEESGHHGGAAGMTVVVDPVDGTNNAIRGLPWFATSLCAVDAGGAVASVVLDLTSGTLYDAIRGQGARANGVPLATSSCEHVADAFVGTSGAPERAVPWSSTRSIGSIALALCYVAAGSLDGFVDFDTDVHGVWDYAGALLICHESGAHSTETFGRPLMALRHEARCSPIVAGTESLLADLQRFRTGSVRGDPHGDGRSTSLRND